MKSNGRLHIIVGMPHTGYLPQQFVSCLFRLQVAFNTYAVRDVKDKQGMELHFVRGSLLPRARRDIVEHAWKVDATHILFLDTDHTFPRNMLHKLILHDKDVVGINHVVKKIPSQPTARYAPKEGDPGYGTPVFSDPDKTGLEKVWRVGTGTLLVKTAVFHKIGLDKFEMRWKEDVANYQGEDWTMAEAMEKAGYDIWVDHDLSRECGHLGHFEFTHAYVGQVVDDAPPLAGFDELESVEVA